MTSTTDMYNGMGTLGKVYIILVAIFGSLAAIELFIYGVKRLMAFKNTTLVEWKVQSDTQCPVVSGNTICMTDVTSKGALTGPVFKVYTSKSVSSGSDISLYTSKAVGSDKRPLILTVDEPLASTYWYIISGAIFTVLFLWLWVYVTHKSMFTAIATGLYGLINLAV